MECLFIGKLTLRVLLLASATHPLRTFMNTL